jgi:DNA repair exonuclease SbcCD ATPase subunit/DNA repair exonuclease SbcCD nuclease subunit
MKRIAHISDTHIRNLKYHREYNHVFKEIYDSLKQEQPDYIVHTGDLAHTKTQLSPEYFEMASNFLKNLADIAPTIIILGNHDGNLKNGDRQDAITPIIDALQHPRLTLLKNSGEYSPEPGLTFNVLSVFDRDNWQPPSNDKSINIALYHGAIQGCQVGSGFRLEHGEDDISIFDEFDYAMLGDIHRIQMMNNDGTIWYAGSTVQQNFGESRLKGYLIWNIKGKEGHSVEKRLFSSPRPFITVRITEDGQLPNDNVPRNARLRLISEHNLPRARLVRLQDYAQTKWSPISVQLLNKASKTDVEGTPLKAENIRDQNTFEKYMSHFLDDKGLEDATRERTMEISREYFKKHVQTDVSRNVTWSLKNMSWDYLFNYGKGNTVDFTKLNGLVGIFGKNYSGKSSIIDAALFGLFNTTSKGERKNVHIINQNQEKAKCRLEVGIGDETYKITRTLERTKTSAKTNLDFSQLHEVGNPESLNGTSRTGTDSNIQSTIGTYRDFILTSLAAQHDSLGFINEGSTKRKEILAKFLDLDIFDEMHKAVKKDSSEMRGYIKHLNGVDWEKKKKKAGMEYSEIIDEIKEKTTQCEKHTKRLEVLREERSTIQEQINAAAERAIDIDVTTNTLTEAQDELLEAEEQMVVLSTEISRTKQLIQDLEDKMVAWETVAPEAQQKIDFLNHLAEQIETKAVEIKKIKREQTSLQSKIDMLHDHEYDPDCRFCSDNEFVKQAEGAKVKIVKVNEKIARQETILKTLEQDYSSEEITRLETMIAAYEEQTNYLKSLRQELATKQLQQENLEAKVSLLEHQIPQYQDDIKYYNDNIEAYENLSSLNRDLQAITKTVNNKQKACDRCQKQLLELMSEKGSTKRLIEEANEGLKKVKEAERDYIAYDLFVQATHPNGISYEVIKSMLSIINSEIASVLSSIVDFEVMIDDDGSSLEIYLKHPRFDPRPLSMGSGAEKTIASMAIRLALISISSLPRPDFFILDEPATALDAEHMEGFVRLLQMIKSHFKTVLLITHLESLKDVVDKTIDIDKVDGYAQVKL